MSVKTCCLSAPPAARSVICHELFPRTMRSEARKILVEPGGVEPPTS